MAYYFDQRHHDSFSNGPYNPNHYSSSITPGGYPYDPRYTYSQRYPASRTTSSQDYRPKAQWPPSPSVEDEAEALAKEYGAQAQKDEDVGGDRGDINQEPVLIETPHGQAERNQDRRFVLVSGGKGDDKTADRPESSERRRSSHKAPPPIKTDLEETPIFTRREPSPYSYTKSSRTPTASNNRTSDEYFLSPDAITPLTTTIPRPDTKRGESNGSGKVAANTSAPRTGESTPTDWKPREPVGLGLNESFSSDDSDLQSKTSTKPHSTRSSSQYSFTKADLLDLEKQKSRSDPAVHIDPYFDSGSSSRYTDSKDSRTKRESTELKLPRSDTGQSRLSATSRVSQAASTPSSPRQAPLSKPTGVSSRHGSYYSDHQSPLPASPLPLSHTWAPSAPQSRRNSQYSGDSPKEARSGPGSRPGSRHGSRHGSRPPSPLYMSPDITQMPSPYQLDFSRHDTFPSSVKDRTKLDSRLASPTTQQSQPKSSNSRPNIHAPLPERATKPLPYPEDDMAALMPSEEHYQYPSKSPATSRRPSPIPRSSSAHPTSSSHRPPSLPLSTARPSLPSYHSYTEGTAKPRRDPTSRLSSGSDSPLKLSQTLVPTPGPKTVLPPCPRSEHSSRHDDWYSLAAHPGFVVCSACLGNVITPAGFARHFVRAPPRPGGAKARCGFADAWTRLAWRLTLREKRRDVKLLEALAEIWDEEPECPGQAVQSRSSWYGLASSMPGFAVCGRDRKALEALMPNLRGIFTRLPGKQRQCCALWTESSHFAQYADMLVEIDDSITHDREPDLGPFVELVREHSARMVCPKDNLLVDQAWYFIPALPEFTVCEECFGDVVAPEVRAGSELAESFIRVPQVPPAVAAGRGGVVGDSCQLYSPRMRKVWNRAVASDDFAYLVRKVRERKGAEMELQEQHAELIRLREGRYPGHAGREVDPEYLRAELAAIAREWKEWE